MAGAGCAAAAATGRDRSSNCGRKGEGSRAGLPASGAGFDGRGVGGSCRWREIGDGGVEERAHISAREREDAAAGDVLRYHVDGNVEVYNGDTEHQHGKGERGGDACEDGERDGNDEEEGHNEAVDWVEQRHGCCEIVRLRDNKFQRGRRLVVMVVVVVVVA